MTDRIVREAECLQITGLCRSARWRLIKEGKFPASVPLTGTSQGRGWLLSELQAWIRQCAAQRDAEARKQEGSPPPCPDL